MSTRLIYVQFSDDVRLKVVHAGCRSKGVLLTPGTERYFHGGTDSIGVAAVDQFQAEAARLGGGEIPASTVSRLDPMAETFLVG
jgi:hypothetical protein